MGSVSNKRRRQSPSASSSNYKTNVLVFGESGSGKSSVVDAIVQSSVVKTSSDATASPFSYQRDGVTISGRNIGLFDTAGFNEGTAGTSLQEEKLQGLLRELTSAGSDGIGLLVYCVRSTTPRSALIRNYNVFYSAICRKKVPIVIVITGLDNESGVERWWTTKEKEFKSHGMHFEDHACVTTLRTYQDMPDVLTRRVADSGKILRNLIVKNCSKWAVDGSCFKHIVTDVRNTISDTSERSSPSTLIICNSSPSEAVDLPHIYQVHPVPQPESSSSVQRLNGDLLIYYARADELSTAREKFHAFYTAYHGNMVPVIVVVKGLEDRTSANEWVKRHIMYDGAGRLFSTFAPDGDNDSVKQQAEQELLDLIGQSCLIRSQGKVRAMYRSFARFVGRHRQRVLEETSTLFTRYLSSGL